jgi:hypothetical protein
MRGAAQGSRVEKAGLTSHICHENWVCAILDDGGLWHHLRGITRRETSGTL